MDHSDCFRQVTAIPREEKHVFNWPLSLVVFLTIHRVYIQISVDVIQKSIFLNDRYRKTTMQLFSVTNVKCIIPIKSSNLKHQMQCFKIPCLTTRQYEHRFFFFCESFDEKINKLCHGIIKNQWWLLCLIIYNAADPIKIIFNLLVPWFLVLYDQILVWLHSIKIITAVHMQI